MHAAFCLFRLSQAAGLLLNGMNCQELTLVWAKCLCVFLAVGPKQNHHNKKKIIDDNTKKNTTSLA